MYAENCDIPTAGLIRAGLRILYPNPIENKIHDLEPAGRFQLTTFKILTATFAKVTLVSQ